MVRFLSEEWLARADRLLADSAGNGPTLVVEQIVRLPSGQVRSYHLRIGGETAGVASGPADAPDLVLTQDYATAAALSRSDLPPAEAFARGLVKVRGNLRVLAEHREALAAADDVFAPLRAETEY